MPDGLAHVRPVWPAPPVVNALVTTRAGGASAGPFATFNLATHTGDRAGDVARNRAALVAGCGLDAVAWLDQQHGTSVLAVGRPVPAAPPVADAAFTREQGVACAVLTADCVPVLLCDRAGTVVGAAHGGWRGLVGGVIGALLGAIATPPRELLAWIGPAIGPERYEVGDDVAEAVARATPAGFGPCVTARTASCKWSADLPGLARAQLLAAGVTGVYGGEVCAFDDLRFYSYRRDGVTGRMATLIWLG